MENNTNEFLGVSEDDSQNPNFTIFNYSTYRDAFWKKRYPVSRVLYLISMFLGWIVIVLSVLFLLVAAGGSGMFKELGMAFLFFGILAGIMLLFVSETILFQIDKNFFAYMDIHKKLEQLKGDKTA